MYKIFNVKTAKYFSRMRPGEFHSPNDLWTSDSEQAQLIEDFSYAKYLSKLNCSNEQLQDIVIERLGVVDAYDIEGNNI